MPVRDIDTMNTHNMHLLKQSGKSWWIGGYLDDRSHKLKWTYISDEGRVFHLGIDLMTVWVADIYNPLDGEVSESGYEEWPGNYGGYVIMRYFFFDTPFFALFGHMDRDTLPAVGTHISRWQKLGTLGTPEQNGHWVPHLHLQVFTGREFEKWKLKVYCTLEDMRNMQYMCPHPWFLLRFYP